jgi:hypothetical protein
MAYFFIHFKESDAYENLFPLIQGKGQAEKQPVR